MRHMGCAKSVPLITKPRFGSYYLHDNYLYVLIIFVCLHRAYGEDCRIVELVLSEYMSHELYCSEHPTSTQPAERLLAQA